jgi:hypothetical protein
MGIGGTMERYPVVGGVRALLAFFGWGALLVAIIMLMFGVASLTDSRNSLAVTQGWMTIVSAVFLALTGLLCVAASEVISIFVNIEVNTRGIERIAQSLGVPTNVKSSTGAAVEVPENVKESTSAGVAEIQGPDGQSAVQDADDGRSTDELLRELKALGYTISGFGMVRSAKKVGGTTHYVSTRKDILALLTLEKARSST